jgi:hypothetical protein
MDFNLIALHLQPKGLNTREIQSDLAATLGKKVPAQSPVTRWLHQAQLGQFSETAVDFTEDAEVDEIDDTILSALEVQSFGSVRHIGRLTRLARSTVDWHLTRSLGFLVRHLHSIPHVLREKKSESES